MEKIEPKSKIAITYISLETYAGMLLMQKKINIWYIFHIVI